MKFSPLVIVVAAVFLLFAALFGQAFLNKELSLLNSRHFDYSQEEIDSLRSLNTSSKLSLKSVFNWDKKLEGLAVKYSTPPTTTAKTQAYMAVAAMDAVAISKQAKGTAKGSFDPLMARILCHQYADECKNFDIRTDKYSEMLSDIVYSKIMARELADNKAALESMRTFVKRQGIDAWEGQNPTTPDAKYWTPWHMSTPEQFRAPPPPAFGSEEDALQTMMVRSAIENATEAQIKAAEYWAELPPSIYWVRLVNEYIAQDNVALPQALEIKYALQTTMADAFVACWDTKFTYWTRRPVMRGLPVPTAVLTPNFPSYTSGHSAVSAAAATVISSYFPSREDEVFALASEARDSRLWGGIHFPIDNDEGFAMGLAIGDYVLDRLDD